MLRQGLRWVGRRWWSVLAPAAVAGVAVWALAADDKRGWAAVAGAVAAVVGAFAPTVLDRARAAGERRERQGRAVAGALVAELPESVAWLLHPQAAVVGFVGRGWLLAALDNWCTDPGAPVVRLLVGAGGVGKTRLARHFADRLTGWVCWPVAPGGEATVAAQLDAGDRPARLLLTVDYAETRDPRALAHLLCVAQRAGGVRALLLARSAGLWWSSLSAAYPAQAHLVDALTVPANVVEVPARIEEHPPQQIVTEAVAAFAARLHRRPPRDVPVVGPDADVPVLRLHARALLAVLGGPRGDDRYDVLAEVLAHEARYWRHRARRDGLPGAGEPAADALLRRLVGVAALLGAESREQATDLICRVPGLGGVPAATVTGYLDWLYGLYPAATTGGRLGTLQPDLLAEDLAVAVLRDCAPADRTTILRGLAPAQAAQALTVLSRARIHQPGAEEMIDAALGADLPVMTEAVLQVGLQFPGTLAPRVASLLAEAEIDPGWAWRTEERVPYPSIEFGRVALALTTRALAAATAATAPRVRAAVLSDHAVRLAEAGRRAEALRASDEAVRLRRELAEADRGAYLPDLAMSVSNHANRLAEVGRWVEALWASDEALRLRRELAEVNRDAYLPTLAMSVNNHATLLSDVGRPAEALRVSAEAVTLYRELAEVNRGAYLPDLAMSVHNHAALMAEVRPAAEALRVSDEAVTLYRELVEGDRDTYLPNLAGTMNNHANRLAEVGRRAEALRVSAEAVTLYRELVEGNRDGYLPELATSLWNVGYVALAVGGMTEEAVAATREAVRLFDELAAAEPDAFLARRDAATATLARLEEALDDKHHGGPG